MISNRICASIFLSAAIALVWACADGVRVGTVIGQQTGQISARDGQMLQQLAEQTEKAVRPMTDQEENYLGRAVAATILNQYRIYQNEPLTRYLNQVGQTVALSSERPLVFGGYHFAILDTGEINALSCPGGIVFLTRGMLSKIRNEEELAAVLAHEVAHVNHRDGAAAIQKSRWMEVVASLGTAAAGKLTGAETAKLLSLFQGSVNDVAKTLLVNGYGRDQEAAADQEALSFLSRAGYDPRALPDFLQTLEKEKSVQRGGGVLATHPGIPDRLAKIAAILSQNRWPTVNHSVRDARFQREMK